MSTQDCSLLQATFAQGFDLQWQPCSGKPPVLAALLMLATATTGHKLYGCLSIYIWCLQTTARRNSIPIDSLSFEYSVVNIDERELQQPPKEGVYVKVRHHKHTFCICPSYKAGSQLANA